MAVRSVRLALVGAFLLGGCGGDGTRAGAISRDSTVHYREQLALAQALSAEKDSIFRELTEATALVAGIGDELGNLARPSAGMRRAGDGERPAADHPDSIRATVRTLTARVRSSEASLARARRRLDAMAGTPDSLRNAIDASRASLENLTATLAYQKLVIDALQAQIGEAREEGTRLATEGAELADTVGALSERENAVWVATGTRKDLVNRGLITIEGGTRFLLFTRTGETLVPARDLDEAAFIRYDMREATEIPLPRATKWYRIVSRQDLNAADPSTIQRGRVRGVLRITSPREFWAPSKFLILVEE